ncbi:SMP-30/gluconolactonase/LRE family protein [Microlunatus sp. Gsoil 973]|uniref:SMP-30/gluconolactonase/LRE family protein n=1 Tax=Microlunatus sp. Gsoil 973 TaxID=2672569 RepID=UPI0012B4EAD0|nr:SMP-30/gluconolactonase/LRE family protein [Microlunatus sp. Gsoil 973]QGN33358.1 SMP-30/gluconolactonase/LRE family protein [Microlunatus sp. Gsoil 973]
MGAIAAAQLSEPVAGLGEGPLWDERIGRLRMVDLLRGDVLTLDENGAAERTHVGKIASVIRPRTIGGYVVGIEHGIAALSEDLEPTGEQVLAFESGNLRMNDGGCDPQGRFYVGSMSYGETGGAGTLYRFDTDAFSTGGPAAPVFSPVSVSNGIQWSADGSKVFFNDTPTRRVAVFDFDAGDGTLHDQRTFVSLPDDCAGSPDGMAIDAEDGIWIALWGGSAVHRYDSSGQLSAVIELPASKITCPTFGGDDWTQLYITSANINVSHDDEPAAGAVFVAEPGIAGPAPYAFAG